MSATISVPSSDRWLARLVSGRPHQLIGPPDRPYLLRWFVIPPNRWCNIYWQTRASSALLNSESTSRVGEFTEPLPLGRLQTVCGNATAQRRPERCGLWGFAININPRK
jgi:hypothetical protein